MKKLPEFLNKLADENIDEKLIVNGVAVEDSDVTLESYCTCPHCHTRIFVSRVAPYVRCPNSRCKMLLPLWGNKF